MLLQLNIEITNHTFNKDKILSQYGENNLFPTYDSSKIHPQLSFSDF